MERLTTDNPKANTETALNLFYVKDCETWVRGGGAGPEYADASLFDFIRSIVKAHIPDAELPEDNNDLSMMMAEWLFDGPESTEGVIATLYTAAWAFSELRHRLAAYEDTGLEPEEIDALKARALMGALESPEMEEYSGSALERVDKLIEQYDALGPIDHLRELVQAEEDGRLVVLPYILTCEEAEAALFAQEGDAT